VAIFQKLGFIEILSFEDWRRHNMGLSQDEQSPLAILEYIEERLMELKEEFCVTGKALCALAKEGISDTNKSELY